MYSEWETRIRTRTCRLKTPAQILGPTMNKLDLNHDSV